MIIVIQYFYWIFDIVGKQGSDVVRSGRILQLMNNTSNESMLNSKHSENNIKWCTFWFDFFNLLTWS